MKSAWLQHVLPPPDGFNDFLEIYDAWIAGKTTNPVRLKVKLEKLWGNLPIAQQRAYSEQLAGSKKLQSIHPLIDQTLSTFKGHIHRWEAHQWKRSL